MSRNFGYFARGGRKKLRPDVGGMTREATCTRRDDDLRADSEFCIKQRNRSANVSRCEQSVEERGGLRT